MSREIKFRAWLKKEKKMVNADYIDFENEVVGFSIPYTVVESGDEYIEVDMEYHYFEDVEIMQSTGLKDKNGKEIYEGDIVKYDWYVYEKHIKTTISYRVQVKYDNGLSAFSIVGNEMSGTLGGWLNTMNAEIEVIGNIYENADLL